MATPGRRDALDRLVPFGNQRHTLRGNRLQLRLVRLRQPRELIAHRSAVALDLPAQPRERRNLALPAFDRARHRGDPALRIAFARRKVIALRTQRRELLLTGRLEFLDPAQRVVALGG